MLGFLRRARGIKPLNYASLNEPIYRHVSHGPILPLEEPTLLERLLLRR